MSELNQPAQEPTQSQAALLAQIITASDDDPSFLSLLKEIICVIESHDARIGQFKGKLTHLIQLPLRSVASVQPYCFKMPRQDDSFVASRVAS